MLRDFLEEDMAAGVQLSSGIHLGYFEPTVDQYLKKIQQAVTAQDLSGAEQALAQLEKMMSTSAQRAAGTGSQPISDLSNIGAVLGSGDLALAGQALNELRNSLSSARGGQSGGASADQTSSTSTSPGEAQTDTPSGDGSGEAARTVDLKA
jgi:hypothetical protein